MLERQIICLYQKHLLIYIGSLYACFVDFRKAFDSVIHDGLRFKLLELGIGTKFYNIKNMHQSSQSCVRLGNGLTDPFKLGVGV